MTPSEVIAFAKNKGARILDLRFMDFPGLWQHLSVPIGELNDAMFADGHGFDGSSIRGWQAINASDMLIIPDPNTAQIDPFLKDPTLVMICDVVDPITRENYSRDPRNIAKKAEAYLRTSGVADVAYFGPEAEFFVFDDIRFDSTENSCYYFVDSTEGQWNTGRVEGPNLGYKPRYKEGYFPVPPMDSQQDIRS